MKQALLSSTLLLALCLMIAPTALAATPDAVPQPETPNVEAVETVEAELPAETQALDLELEEPVQMSAPAPCTHRCFLHPDLCPEYPGHTHQCINTCCYYF